MPVRPEHVQDLRELLRDGQKTIREVKARAGLLADQFAKAEQADDLVAQAVQLVQLIPTGKATLVRERRVWQLVLGTDAGFLPAALAGAVILHNLGRFIVTYLLAPLRDEEERTGDSPSWNYYRWLWYIHQLLTPLLLISTASGVYHLWTTLRTPVLLPG